nr:MAG TPA: hypothetical protein [Bacteriophage sp.]
MKRHDNTFSCGYDKKGITQMIERYGQKIKDKYEEVRDSLLDSYTTDIWEILTSRDDIYMSIDEEDVYFCGDGSKGDVNVVEYLGSWAAKELIQEYIKEVGEQERFSKDEEYELFETEKLVEFIEDIYTEVLVDILYKWCEKTLSEKSRAKVYKGITDAIRKSCGKVASVGWIYERVIQYLEYIIETENDKEESVFCGYLCYEWRRKIINDSRVGQNRDKVIREIEKRYATMHRKGKE